MKLNFISIISIIAIFQSILLSIFFFNNKKGVRVSNNILGSLLCVYTLYITINFLKKSRAGSIFLNTQYPILLLAGEVILLAGPLLYLYIRTVRDPGFQLQKRHLYHIIPFILSEIIVGIKIYYAYQHIKWLPDYSSNRLLFLLLHLLVYIIACLLSLKINIRSLFSRITDVQLSWLRYFLLTFLLLWVNLFFIYILRTFLKSGEHNIYASTIYYTFMFIFINCIAFIAWKKPDIFSPNKKYQKSELKESDKEHYRKRLLEAMEKEKLYLDPLLTLPSLAKQLSVPVTHLSQIINESFNSKFYDFINRYRIEECCRHLKDYSQTGPTILEIAYTVGFNSKSTFNEAFKKHTGITPTEFIQRAS